MRDPQLAQMGFCSTYIHGDSPILDQFRALYSRIEEECLLVESLVVGHDTYVDLDRYYRGSYFDKEFNRPLIANGIVGYLWGATVYLDPRICGVVVAYPSSSYDHTRFHPKGESDEQ